MQVDLSTRDPDIAGMTANSRTVEPGFLFAALPGNRVDGRDFIADALARGAVAVLAPPGTALPPGPSSGDMPVPLLTSPEPRRQLALLAARFYGEQPKIAAAVTGTNGKTSVAWFTRCIWEALGHQPAAMGTLGVTASAVPDADGGGLTTADPVTLHRDLKLLADNGIDHIVIEASSHGLEQARLDGVRFAAGAFPRQLIPYLVKAHQRFSVAGPSVVDAIPEQNHIRTQPVPKLVQKSHLVLRRIPDHRRVENADGGIQVFAQHGSRRVFVG